MSKRASEAEHPTKVDWKIPLRGKLGEWYPVVRVGRHVPFGYKQDENDEDLLIPIPEELELLEKAKLFLKEYSVRQVSNWLSKESGRYISHVGLYKRVRMEEKRRRAASNYKQYAKKYKEASRKSEKIEKERIGGRATRKLVAGKNHQSFESEGRCPTCGARSNLQTESWASD